MASVWFKGLVAVAATVWSVPPASATPAPLTEPYLPTITPSGLAVGLVPLVGFPADASPTAAGTPTARIDYVVPEPNSNTLFVNDTLGQLYRTNTAGATPSLYLDLTQQNVGIVNYLQQASGFGGIAFNPNFNGDPTKPGYGVFYTEYLGSAAANPPNVNASVGATAAVVIREWTATDPNAATFSGTSRLVMSIGVTPGDEALSGASIGFNPTAKPGSADYGLLYIGTVEGGYNDGTLSSQSMTSPFGKMLRIDPNAGPNGASYTVPATNPFVGTASVLPEIWASGLRNAQSFSWDPDSGTMYIDDIGQGGPEEVDVGVAGANYGWPLREGTFATTYGIGVNNPGDESVYPLPSNDSSYGFTYPIAEYDHTEGDAIGPGFLYQGSLIPALDGMYVFGDIVNGELFYFDPTTVAPGGTADIHELLVEVDGSVVSPLANYYGYSNDYQDSPRVDLRLSEDGNGNLLAALKSTGEVYDIVPATVPEPPSFVLLGGAVVALAGAMSRRRRRGTCDTSRQKA